MAGDRAGAALPAACRVAIIGGGPAGLAAAAELGALGLGPVVVIEREDEAGGIPRHCGHPPFGMREFGRVLTGPAYARRMADRARAAGAVIATGVTVIALAPGPLLHLATADGLVTLAAERVITATGARETSRAARLIGGTKPAGVMSTGALQGLVHLDGIRPFARPVVVGSELVAFSALLTCRHLGIRPVAMIEPGPRPVARWPAAWLPRLLGVPLYRATGLTAIEGDRQVTGVVLAGPQGAFRLAADGVVLSGHFLPEASLLRDSHVAVDAASGGPVVDEFGRTGDPAVFAAGNLLRPIETAGWSAREGRRAAHAVALSLAGGLPAGPGRSVALRGGGLAYVVPQRFLGTSPAGGAAARAPGFQLRAARPLSGRLVLTAGEREIWSRALDTLPERRILVPFDAAAGGDGPLAFAVEERR